MASVLNEDSVEKKLRTVTNSQDSIQTLSLWIIHHKANHAKIVELWMRVLKKSATPAHRLTLFYLCNDVVQNCKKKKAFIYNSTFKEYLREAASFVREPSVKGKVERIFNIWGERGVYDTTFIKSLHNVLNGQQVKSYNVRETVEESSNRPVSQSHRQPDVSEQHEVEPKDAAAEQQAEADAEESARILAEFKPQDMIDMVTAFLRQEVEIKSRAMKLSHLKLDKTSVEAVKQLKDRSVGRHFSSQCDEAAIILDELIKRQTGHMGDLRTLLETLSLSETFYEEQYREAKIVANAYRNFGARINNMKKKLDELKKSLPEPDSPIPSPDINAPSPENTPPFVGMPDYSNSPPSLVNYSSSPHASVNYSSSPHAPVNYSQGLQQNSWQYGDTESAPGLGSLPEDMDSFPGSPLLEAPSPEGSPPDLNLDAPGNVSGSLDSRLASFFSRDQLDTPSSPPVYTPQRPLSVVATNRPIVVVADEDGSTTPLDDEAPTTPVQDEHLTSPPKQSPPPKKENPIDFLSRLISETQKVPTVKSGTQSFLDSLTMMTMAGKKPETSVQKQQITTAPSPWTPWASNSSENNTSPSQPSSPSSYIPSNSVPSSPDTFPSVLPMLPPPIPIPVAPPPSLSLDLSMPPPPPPFVLTQALTPRFTSPPPHFQQTSPGQKENWPDAQHSQTTEHANSIRTTISSVLKELVSADGLASKSGSHMDSMEVRSDDESSSTPKSDAETAVDAQTEFGQKLKQKTSLGALKPHAFVPNPERPNLMTLTVSDDLDEVDMIDNNTVVEEARTWLEKPDMSKVRSRSQSREKDTSFQHPQMDTWVRGDGGDGVENSGLAASDSNPFSRSSLATAAEPFHSNNRTSNDGDKFPERFCKNNNWRQADQKYDQFYKRGHRGRGNFRPFRGHQGVQAYTRAYKEAFQQCNQAPFLPFFRGPPPMNPRLPGYGQY
ncbi:hypothetical protein BsWGS_04970 [Bradybaena similaris]